MKRAQELSTTTNRRHAWFTGHTEPHFARKVNAVTDLAEPVQRAFSERLQPGETVRRIIFAPFQGVLKNYRSKRRLFTFSLPWEFTPDNVLLLTDRNLFVAHLPDGDTCEVETVPLDDLLYLRSGVVLLLSWIEICWVQQGAIRREVIYFNTVCDKLFISFLEMIRCDWGGGRPGLLVDPESNHLLLSSLPYKFMNIIPRRLLLANEKVSRVLFRPAMYQALLAWINRVIAPQMALVITNHQLLLASENLSGSEGDYGLASIFLPLSRIRGAEALLIEDQAYLLIHLAYHGAYEDQTIPFPAEMDFELRCFVDALNTSL